MEAASDTIALSEQELRAVTGYAVECARKVLAIFEKECPADARPRDAIDAAEEFARGGRRTNDLRKHGWAAYRAAQEAASPAAGEAARAASQAVGAAFLHPKASAHQVKHILGAAVHAARALELASREDPNVAADVLTWTRSRASTTVTDVLGRYPAAPKGGGRIGELLRKLDTVLRNRTSRDTGSPARERRPHNGRDV